MTGIRDIERKIDALEGDDRDDLEIVIRDTTIGTGWSASDGDHDGHDLEPGETRAEARRYYYDERGNWVVEEIDPASLGGRE